MASLVADYSSDSSNDTEEKLTLRPQQTTQILGETKEPVSKKLPSPTFLKSSNEASCEKTQSVFSNPFREAEVAQTSILEKHVKMTPINKLSSPLNGKQICWNFRKGKCKYGDNCKFAHDNDKINPIVSEAQNNVCSQVEADINNCTESELSGRVKKKKRPGLTQGLIPSKKIMKTYFQQHKNIPKV